MTASAALTWLTAVLTDTPIDAGSYLPATVYEIVMSIMLVVTFWLYREEGGE